jgi:hypothetical protein
MRLTKVAGVGVAVGTHPAAIFPAGAGFRLRPEMHVIIRFITPPSKPLPQARPLRKHGVSPVRDLTEWGLCDTRVGAPRCPPAGAIRRGFFPPAGVNILDG